MAKDVATTQNEKPLTAYFANEYGVDQNQVMGILTSTCIKGGTANDAAAFMIVAKQYKLNPFIKEIYAYKDKAGGVVPVVSVDGWLSLIHRHPEFGGMDIRLSETMVEATQQHKQAHEWVEVVIHRVDKDTGQIIPTPPIREYFEEVFTSGILPWKTHTKRMHRHKAIIQAARVVFGFSGIYDEDEAKRIVSDAPEKVNAKKQADDIAKKYLSDEPEDAEIVTGDELDNLTIFEEGEK